MDVGVGIVVVVVVVVGVVGAVPSFLSVVVVVSCLGDSVVPFTDAAFSDFSTFSAFSDLATPFAPDLAAGSGLGRDLVSVYVLLLMPMHCNDVTVSYF